MIKRIDLQKLILKVAVAGISVSLASQVYAQEPPQTVDLKQNLDEFLKPQTTKRPAIFNCRMADGNFMTTFHRECVMTADKEVISCKLSISALPSGGGDWYSHWYEVTSDLAPNGYKFKESSFHMPEPRPCNGDDNSSYPQANAQDMTSNNPDPSWVGHPNGNGGSDAKCFLLGKDLNRVTWLYAFRGVAGGWKAQWGPDVIASITDQPPKVLSEGAELDVVYVKSD
jgi:hypothetical protein